MLLAIHHAPAHHLALPGWLGSTLTIIGIALGSAAGCAVFLWFAQLAGDIMGPLGLLIRNGTAWPRRFVACLLVAFARLLWPDQVVVSADRWKVARRVVHRQHDWLALAWQQNRAQLVDRIEDALADLRTDALKQSHRRRIMEPVQDLDEILARILQSLSKVEQRELRARFGLELRRVA